MTDEAKPMLEDVFAPWRAWPEWMLISPTYDVQKHALCARVWREAQEVMPSRMRELAEEREAERTRAEAAEARAARLAAALESLLDIAEDWAQSVCSEFCPHPHARPDTDCPRIAPELTAARAALADVLGEA